MINTDRTEGLRALIRQGLQAVSQQNTTAHLGDRSTYVGMSDIGQHWECPRAALARKVLPITGSLERLLTLQRGHWFESGVGQALASLGLHVLPQLEIYWQHQGVPIKAHLDFVLVWGAPVNAIRILEVKSTDKLSDTPHDSHLLQLHGKIGLLAQAWDKPAFSSLTLTPGRFSVASPPAPRSGAMPRLQLTLRPLTTTIFSTSQP